MQVILREDVPHLGEVGDLVIVKPGYARNFLMPRGLAVMANERQVRKFAHEKRIIEVKVARLREGAEEIGARLSKVKLKIEKAAGENGKLFGSVTSMEIESLLRQKGFDVSRRKIQMTMGNLKELGSYDIGVRLHRDVTVTIKVTVSAKNLPAPAVEAVAEPVSAEPDSSEQAE